MTIVRSKTSNLDPKEVFMLWIELDTLEKVSFRLASKNIVNPRTKNPYTKMALYYSAMKWILENSDEARKYYQDYNAEYSYDDDIWNEWLIRKAIYIYKNKSRIVLWLRRMGLDDGRYNHIYNKELGLYDWP